MALRVAAVMFRVALRVVVPDVPEMVTELLLATGNVVTRNVTLVALAGTVAETGTVAMVVLLLLNATVTPDAGAGPFSVTVPVDVPPPSTELGLKENPLNVGARTVRLAVRDAPL